MSRQHPTMFPSCAQSTVGPTPFKLKLEDTSVELWSSSLIIRIISMQALRWSSKNLLVRHTIRTEQDTHPDSQSA